MLNLSPSDKKLIALFLILFVIVFSVLIIDFYLNAKNVFDISDTMDAIANIEQTLTKISQKPENPEPSMIRKSLNRFFELANNKNYEELFQLISDDAKKNIFNDSFDNFIEFIDGYMSKPYSPYFTEYEKFDNTYMVLVSFVPYSNTNEDIINTKRPEKADTFFIHYLDDNSYKFSFLGYAGEHQLGNGVENSQFRVILNKTILYKTKSEFYFTITNNTNTTIHIPAKYISGITGFKRRFYEKPITIAPNSSTDFTFSISTGLSIADAIPKRIYFSKIRVDGSEYSFDIPATFCVDI